MTTFISTFNSFTLAGDVRVLSAPPVQSRPVHMRDPAVAVMTDLKNVKAVTIAPDVPIDTARQVMICAHVRLIVVVDAQNSLLGVVTARDLMDEKPVRVATELRVPHRAVLVEHIMTGRAQIDALRFDEVERATVSDVVRELRDRGRQHALVVEPRSGGDGYVVRGIFSITQIGRQLGVVISSDGHAQDFAELEHLLADTGRETA